MAYSRIKHLIGSTADWTSANPVLLAGEIGYEQTTNGVWRSKIGNGSDRWNTLPYSSIDLTHTANLPVFTTSAGLLQTKSPEEAKSALGIQIVSNEEALAGVDDGKFMTPAKTVVNVNGQLVPILSKSPWVKIASYETAGSGNWIAPDLFGDGRAYEIGVVIIGGGGSGAVYAMQTASWIAAIGGASGYALHFTMQVTPGTSYPYVIGAKGTARVTTVQASIAGLAGGTSSFNGKTANGGSGGGIDGLYGAIGGQCAGNNSYGGSTVNPFGGTPVINYSSTLAPNINPNWCYNPFENRPMLGAGGCAQGHNTAQCVVGLGGKDPKTGLGGGDGKYQLGNGTFVGNNATAAGCGGGGLVCPTWSSGSATSGAGADGAVWIYARKAVS